MLAVKLKRTFFWVHGKNEPWTHNAGSSSALCCEWKDVADVLNLFGSPCRSSGRHYWTLLVLHPCSQRQRLWSQSYPRRRRKCQEAWGEWGEWEAWVVWDSKLRYHKCHTDFKVGRVRAGHTVWPFPRTSSLAQEWEDLKKKKKKKSDLISPLGAEADLTLLLRRQTPSDQTLPVWSVHTQHAQFNQWLIRKAAGMLF